ncbi:MAG: TetR/AcrR family transcriptional regulator [Ruminococcaceae bacterium]|nr:TetR/AcrR family transcriptional regulator [Oscillospiraceae bacterium]
MSLQELREKNIERVTEEALNCFIENGVERSKISDIARRAGLTERSVFRYFPNKTELLVAASFLYWHRALDVTGKMLERVRKPGMTGIEEIEIILKSYCELVFTDPQGIRFSLDAEVALFNAGKNHAVINRPPEKFEVGSGPMAKAVKRGMKDGTLDKTRDLKQLYYNSYDAILGVMQRMTVDVPSVNEVDGRKRLMQLCDMFVYEFSAKK